MIQKFLKLDRIILFIVLVTPWTFVYIYPFENVPAYVIACFVAATLWLIWLFSLDDAITKRIPPAIRPSNQFFQFNLIILYINAWVVTALVATFMPFYYTGIIVLPFLVYALYSFYAFLAVISHLSKILTYAEKKDRIMFRDRKMETVGFAFFPIGIWWLQPRIQKIMKQQVIPVQKYVAFK